MNNLADVIDRVYEYLKIQQIQATKSSTEESLKIRLTCGMVYINQDTVNYRLAGDYYVSTLRIRLELNATYDSNEDNCVTLEHIKLAYQLVDDLKHNFGNSDIYTKLDYKDLVDAKLVLSFPEDKRKMLLKSRYDDSIMINQPNHKQVNTYFCTYDRRTYYLQVIDKDTFILERYTV